MFLPIDLTSVGALIVASIASYTDIRTGKIFNKLTFPAAGVGILARAAEFAMTHPDKMVSMGFAGALNAIGGWISGVVLMAAMKLFLRQLGHGDTKLMGALGAFIGPGLILGTFLYFCIIYAVISIGWLAASFPWNQFLAVRDLSLCDLTKFNEVRKKAIPIAPFIAGGLLLSIIFKSQTLFFFGFTAK